MESPLLNSRGQSTIEYLLLLIVVATFAATVFNSAAFRNIFGKDSSFFAIMQNKIQFTYRHGLEGEKEDSFNYGDGSAHHSYYSQEEGKSRFFLPLEGYGE